MRLKRKRLVRQIQRMAVDQVDLHLRRPILVDQRVDLDVLVFAELIDVVEQRIELVHRRDAVALPARLRATRTPDRRLQRIVRVDVRLDQIELELRSDHRLPTSLRIQLEHVTQHVTRCHRHAAPVRVETIVDDLRGRLSSPRHAAHRLRIGLEHDVDLGGAHGVAGLRRVIARHRLQENAFRQAHAFVFGKLLRGHDLAARDACHVRDDGLHFGNAVIAEELLDFVSHGVNLSYVLSGALPFLQALAR